MTVAEFIAELEKRAMWHREKAEQFIAGGGESGAFGAMIEDARALSLDEAALLARQIESDVMGRHQ